MEEVDGQRVDAGLPVLQAAELVEDLDQQGQVVVEVVGHHIPLDVGLGIGDKLVGGEIFVGIEVALQLPDLFVPLAGVDGVVVGVVDFQHVGRDDDPLELHLVQGEGLRAEDMGQRHLPQQGLHPGVRRTGGQNQQADQGRQGSGRQQQAAHGQPSVEGASITS